MANVCMYYVGNLPSSWSGPRRKYSRGTAGDEIAPLLFILLLYDINAEKDTDVIHSVLGRNKPL